VLAGAHHTGAGDPTHEFLLLKSALLRQPAGCDARTASAAHEEPHMLVLAALAEASVGHLPPPIGQIFPPEQAAGGARCDGEHRTTVGKTLLQTQALTFGTSDACGPSLVRQKAPIRSHLLRTVLPMNVVSRASAHRA
jgi:hypothetical protein